MRKLLLLTTVSTLIAVAAPGLAQGASYKFKVDLSMTQTTDWAHEVRQPRDGYCGDRDVHYVYKGEGDGQLKAKISGGRVTFKGTSAFLQSSEFRMPGTVVSNAAYTVARQGVPDDNCEVPPPIDPNGVFVGTCNPLVRQPGTARSFLMVVKGRLQLFGGFYRKDKKACGDPSLYTGVLGYGGRPTRRDVNKLITSKRVRSIELSSSTKTKFGLKNLSDFGANTRQLKASGEGSASWKVKLTRIR